MTITTLVIVIGVGLGATEIKINFEDAFDCFAAMDNFHTRFYRKIDRDLIPPPVTIGCVQKGKKV